MNPYRGKKHRKKKSPFLRLVKIKLASWCIVPWTFAAIACGWTADDFSDTIYESFSFDLAEKVETNVLMEIATRIEKECYWKKFDADKDVRLKKEAADKSKKWWAKVDKNSKRCAPLFYQSKK